jgi:hypothetical protein
MSDVLLDLSIARTLDSLTADLLARQPADLVEAWLFEPPATRRAAEAAVAKAGIRLRLRSAFKPLLFFFLEEIETDRLRKVTIRYPQHAETSPMRFLSEAYPLAGLRPGVDLTFVAAAPSSGDAPLFYDVALERDDGQHDRHQVFAPTIRQAGLRASCGWLRMQADHGAPLATEFETIPQAALVAIRGRDWREPDGAPQSLTVSVILGAEDEPLGWGEEVISFKELLHEELLFALREVVLGDRREQISARCVRVVPDIRGSTDGSAHVILVLSDETSSTETARAIMPLDHADRPLGMTQIRAELAAIGGEAFAARSAEGREVAWLHRKGASAPVLITAGQHANETSGVVGALRAAHQLAQDPEAHFALVPVENVDGYELHQRLIAQNRRHMHHAARFTALGDDILPERQVADFEHAARRQALVQTQARLHINLHGYPSHEWSRPLSGYLPKGFEDWSMPRGFFLILMHHPGWAEAAHSLLDFVSARLAEDPELVALNRRQIAIAQAHSPLQSFPVQNDVFYIMSETESCATPLMVITEAPDETVYGAAFQLQQRTQMRAALACVEAMRRIEAGL